MRVHLLGALRKRLDVAAPHGPAAGAELDAAEAVEGVGAVRGAAAAVAVRRAGALEDVGEPREQELLGPVSDQAAVPVAVRCCFLLSPLGLVILVVLVLGLVGGGGGVEAVPKLDMLARQGHDVACLDAAETEVVLDEAVAPHHHVDGPAEEAGKVGQHQTLGPVRDGDLDSEQDLAGDPVGVGADGGRHVGEGAVGLALAAVLVEGDGVVHDIPNLGQELELGVRGPARGVVDVVAGQRRAHAEPGQGVAVAHAEPAAGALSDAVDVAPEQLAVAPLLARLLRRHEKEGFHLAGHQRVAVAALEQIGHDPVERVAEDVVGGLDVDQVAPVLGDDAHDDDTHERDVAFPVGESGDAASQVLPRTSIGFLFLGFRQSIDAVQVVGDIWGIVPHVTELETHDVECRI
ncbi:hypothetical protein PG988_013845 [Apiospora saccharicola]